MIKDIYIDVVPENFNNINNDDRCFFESDLNVLDSIFILNNLETEYESYLDLGLQTWVSGRFKLWVATYVQNGPNGLTQRLQILPENFGDLTNLSVLLLEKHSIYYLPDSFSSLTNLITLFINNNLLISLPGDIGNLS